MQKKNLVRLFMLQSINGYANSNPAIIATVLAFKNGNTEVGNIINRILARSGSQSQTIIGSGSAKELKRTELNNITYNIIKATRGWALLNNNDLNLAGKLNYSPSRISRVSDKNIAERAGNWLALVQAVIANLADWNVTPESLIDWQAAIDKYTEVLLLPKNEKEARMQKIGGEILCSIF